MASGVAKAIYEKYPKVKSLFHKFSDTLTTNDRLGKLQKIKVSEEISVFNSFTQLYYGNSKITGEVYTSMDLLVSNIKKALELSENENRKLYIPKLIGCDLAGGDWNELWNGIKDLSDNLVIVDFN